MPDPATNALEADKSRRLRRMRIVATSLLGLAALIYIGATAMQPGHAAWGYVAACAEAAMVGALADWFAVTALFRYPLGVRLPHTAIIPRNKDRIAENLGEFVQGEFFSNDRVTQVVEEFDPAQRAAQWMVEPRNAQRLADGVGGALTLGLNFIGEDAVRNYLKRIVANNFDKLDLSSLVAVTLHGLTLDKRHQALFNQVLHSLNDYLAQPETRAPLARAIAQKLPSWLKIGEYKEKLGHVALNRMLESLSETLADMDADENHPLRLKFDETVTVFIEKLRNDSDLRERIQQHQRALGKNKALASYIDSLWHDTQIWLARDLASNDSVFRAKVAAVLQGLGRELLANPALRATINGQILEMLPPIMEETRPRLSHFISHKMKEWKDEEIVRKLELNIGPDLQFIRINGTLIGGLVGLLIHTATVWLQ